MNVFFSDKSPTTADNQWLKKHGQRTELENHAHRSTEYTRESLIHKLMPKKVFNFQRGNRTNLVFKDTPSEFKEVDVMTTKLPNRPEIRLRAAGQEMQFQAEESDQPIRKKREVSFQMLEHTVETLVVVDKEMFEFHKSESLIQPYVLTIMNIVSFLLKVVSSVDKISTKQKNKTK